LKYNVVEEPNWKRKLEITIPEEDVSKKFSEVYGALKNEAKIPGFRPGKAPLEIVRQRYSKLAEKEVLETMVPEAYNRAIKETGMFPINDPQFSELKVENGKPIVFTAEFEIRPEFELKKYTGFTLKRGSEIIHDADVEKAFRRIIDQHSSLKTREAAAIEGDVVIVDMEKISDPEGVIKDDKKTDFAFELDRNATLPEFCDGLIGAHAGETREINLTYPQDYYNPQLAGKQMGFRVLVKEVKEIIRPELNAEFCAQFGGAQNEQELRERIRGELLQQRRNEIENDIREQAIKSVITANEFDLPQSLLEDYLTNVVNDIKEEYKNKKIDEAEIRENYRALGIRFIRWSLLYHKIAEAEKITVAKEDTDKWLQNFADKNKITVDQAREYLAQQRKIQDIKETILEDKVLDLIIKSSTIEDM